MSYTVDNRAVHMEFDNRQFEQNIKTTMSSLDKFKEKLNLTGATKGIEAVDRAAGKVNMSPLGAAVEQVQAKFSALQVIGVTALANITNSAVNAGKQLVKSISIDQISAGWAKFSDKTTAVGTLVGQGYDLSTVNAQLERLNWFTDETSYNFVDMVANIAKFTASGQDLEASVTAMEGIATWAALSGQNAATASRAMYQLSQAMGSGVMRKEDFKSIQNASMDTDEFRQICLDTAVALGTLKKNADGTYQSLVAGKEAFTKAQFADHLTEDLWLTSDVMMEVYTKYASAVDQIYEYAEARGITASEAIDEMGDSLDEFALKAFKAAQEARTWSDVVSSVKDAVSTGWMNIFEDIVGNYEEATQLWTGLANNLYDIFAQPLNDVHDLLNDALSSGWSKLIDSGISKASEYKDEIRKVAEETSDSFEKIIENNPDDWNAALREGFESGAISTDTLSKAFDNLYNKMVSAENVSEYTEAEIKAIKKLKEEFDNGTLSMEEFADAMTKVSGREHLIQSFKNVLEAVSAVISTVKDSFTEIFPAITAEQLYDFTKRLEEFTEKLIISEETASKLKDTFSGLFSILGIAFDIIGEVGSFVGEILNSVFSNIFPASESFLDMASSAGKNIRLFRQWLKTNKVFATSLNFVKNTLVSVYDSIKNAITWFSNLEEVQNIIKTLTDMFGKLKNNITKAFSKVSNKFSTLFSSIDLSKVKSLQDLLDQLNIKNFVKSINETNGPLEIFKSKISSFGDAFSGSFQKVKDTISEVTSFFTASVQNEKFLPTLFGLGSGITLIQITKGVTKLVNAITDSFAGFSKLGPAVTGAVKSVKKWIDAKAFITKFSVVSGIIKDATLAFLGLAVALYILSKIEPEKLDKLMTVLTDIGAVMLEFTIAMGLITKIGLTSIEGAGSIIALAAGVWIIVQALKELIDLDLTLETLVLPLVGLIIILGALAGACVLLGKFAPTLPNSAWGILAVGVGVKLLVSALKDITELPTDKVGDSVETLLACMAGLTVVSMAMSGITWSTGVGALTLIISLKLLVSMLNDFEDIAWSLKQIRNIIAVIGLMTLLSRSIGNISKTDAKSAGGMLALAVSITILCAALKILETISFGNLLKSVLALVIIMAAFGKLTQSAMGDMASSKSIMAMAVVIGVLAAALLVLSIVPFVALLSAVAALSAVIFVTSLLVKEASGLKQEAFWPLVAMIGMLVVITGSIMALSNNIAGALGASAAISVLILALAGAMKLINGCKPMSLEVIGSLAAMFVAVVALGGLLLILDKLGINAMNAIGTAVSIGILVAALSASVFLLSKSNSPFSGSVITGIADMMAVILAMTIVFSALGALVTYLPEMGQFISAGIPLLEQMALGLGKAIGAFAGGLLEGLASVLPQIGAYLSEFATNMEPFFSSMSNVDIGAVEGLGVLIAAIAGLSFASILDGFAERINGVSSTKKLIEDLGPLATAIVDFDKKTADVKGYNIKNIAHAIQAIADVGSTLEAKGGIIQKVFGEKSLGDFGADLGTLGTNIRSMYDTLVGGENKINPNDLYPIRDLIQAFSDVASTLDTHGGWIKENVTGDNTLKAFAEDINAFASELLLLNYKSIDLEKINTVSSAITTLSTAADTLSTHGGAIKSWITGDNSLAAFGEQINSFVGSLVALNGEGEGSIDISSLTNISTQLSTFISDLNTLIADFTAIDLTAAMESSGSLSTLFSDLLTALPEDVESFSTAGTALMQALNTSISGYGPTIKETIRSIMQGVVTAINNFRSQLQQAAIYAGQGIVAGLMSMWDQCYAAGFALGQAANAGFNDALDINSPSRVMYKSGVYTGQGAVNGIVSMVGKVYQASKYLGNSVNDGFNSAISDISDRVSAEIDTSPRITPILDLSNVEQGASRLAGIFNGGTIRAASQANNIASSKADSDMSVTPKGIIPVVNNNFTQNNYSPKALSRAEIYRQTKSQFSAMERMANA